MKRTFLLCTAFSVILASVFVYFTMQHYGFESEIARLDERNNQLVGENVTLRVAGSGGGVEEYVPATTAVTYLRPTLFPLPASKMNHITSPQGVRPGIFVSGLWIHKGIDCAGVYQSEVLATMDGVVVEAYPPPDGYYRGHPVYGGMVRIRHANGYETLYAHLSSKYVKEGDIVTRGQVIGRVGNTGLSDGAHLHYEIWLNGEYINPLELMAITIDALGYVTFNY